MAGGDPSGTGMTGPPVARRLVLVFPGFEPMPAQAHMQRFMREARNTAPVYGMRVEAGVPTLAEGASAAPSTSEIDIRATGEGWETATKVVVYGLGDLNDFYADRPMMLRLADGLAALADFLVTGTFFRFVATSWRYGLFFLYPIGITLLIATVAAIAALAPACLFGGWHLLWSLPLGAATFRLAVAFAARHMHYLLMMDDWSCARDIAREARPQVAGRIALIRADARRRIEAGKTEEVVFAAHSFGAITAVAALAEAVRHGAFGKRRAGLLTAGSSLLKVGLHPAAAQLRADVAAVATRKVAWMDVQSRADPINFYGCNPVRALGRKAGRLPRTVRVRFEDQLSPETYRTLRRNLFRVHRQFVFAVERRHPYAFHAILLGPERLRDVVARGGLAERWSRQ